MNRTVIAICILMTVSLTACTTILETPEISTYAEAINPDLGKFTLFMEEEQKLSQQLEADPTLRYSSDWSMEMWIALGMTEVYLENMVKVPYPAEGEEIHTNLTGALRNYRLYKDAKWAFIGDVNPTHDKESRDYYSAFLQNMKRANKIIRKIK